MYRWLVQCYQKTIVQAQSFDQVLCDYVKLLANHMLMARKTIVFKSRNVILKTINDKKEEYICLES